MQSEEGKGSLFWMQIPFVHEYNISDDVQPQTPKTEIEKDNSVLEHNQSMKIKGDKPTVIVAEDDESNFIYMQHLLGSKYAILRAINGIQAIDLAREGKADIILMDIRMPEMNGFDATKAIRVFDSSIPIIAVSAYAFEDDRKKALECGCNDYVVKPLKAELFFSILKKYFEA